MKRLCPQALRVFLPLVCVQLLLVLVYSIDALIQGPNRPVFFLIDLDSEANVPTWFASFQLALISANLWSLSARHANSRLPSRPFLRFLALVFLIMSADEVAQLHEHVTEWVGHRYIDWLPQYASDHVGVTLSGALVLLVVSRIAYRNLSTLWKLSRHASALALAGILTGVLGGVVLETIGYKLLSGGAAPSLYRAEVAAEEFLEMFGASLILYAVVSFAHVEEKEVARGAVESRLRWTTCS